MPSVLECIETEFLDEPCLAALGDTIQYQPEGGGFAPLMAFVEYGDLMIDTDTGKLISQDITAEVLKSSVPAKPGRGVLLTLAKTGDTIFKAVNTQHAGSFWRFRLEIV